MASSDVRKWNAYLQYIVQPTDMDDIQRWLRDGIDLLGEAGFGGSVLSGLNVSVAGGMTVQVSAGIGCSPSGDHVVVTSDIQQTLASDASFDRRSLLVLRPKETPTQYIPSPTGGPNVPLHNKFEYDLLVLGGTPSATPVYPSVGVNDIVLMGFYIPAAAVSVSVGDFEVTMRAAPKKHRRKIREVSADYSAASGEGEEDVIEFDASAASGVVTLPPASVMLGREVTIMKVDSTANEVQIVGNGGELMSGQSSVVLDAEWQSVKMYAHKSSWRIL